MSLDLQPDEELVVDRRMSWISAFLDWRVLLTLGLWALVNKFGSRYQATNKRVYRRYGIISRRTNTVALEDVRDVRIRQGIVGRLLLFGDVGIATAGTAAPEISFRRVGNPASVQSDLQTVVGSAIDCRKEQKGRRG